MGLLLKAIWVCDRCGYERVQTSDTYGWADPPTGWRADPWRFAACERDRRMICNDCARQIQLVLDMTQPCPHGRDR